MSETIASFHVRDVAAVPGVQPTELESDRCVSTNSHEPCCGNNVLGGQFTTATWEILYLFER